MVAILYVIGLFCGYILLGGLLAIYHAPVLVWLGTQAVTVHLAWVGTDAIALAVAWIVGTVWAGAFAMAWPKSIPWHGMLFWSAALFFDWLFALVLIVSLALAKRHFKTHGWSQTTSFFILAFTTYLGLAIGGFTSSIFLGN